MAESSSAVSSSAVSPGRRGVRLRRFAQVRYQVGAVSGYRFAVRAYGAVGMPATIFRFRRGPGRTPGTEDDVFDGICSPADIEEYPEDAPAADAVPQFFRLSGFDLVLRSQVEADEAWDVCQKEVATLVATLDLMDDLAATEDVAIGDPPVVTPPSTP